MGIDEGLISQVKTQIHAFDGAKVTPIRIIKLPIYAVDQILRVNVFIINTPSIENVIMGREWIHVVKGVVSTLHQVLRFQYPKGMYTIDIRGDPTQNQRCLNMSSSGKIRDCSTNRF